MKDHCYRKVKASYAVFPSARASQAIAKCRKGSGNVRKTEKGTSLKRWQKENWKDQKTGKACGAGGSNEYCRPSKRVSSKTPKTSGEMSSAEKKKKIAEKSRVGMGARVSSLRKRASENILNNITMNKKASLIIKSAFLSNLGAMAGKAFKSPLFAMTGIGMAAGIGSMASGLGSKFGNKARAAFSSQPAQPTTNTPNQPQNNTKFAPNSSLQPNQAKPFTYPGGMKFTANQVKTNYSKPQNLNTYTPGN